MSLRVRVDVNGRIIAKAVAVNTGGVDPWGNHIYRCRFEPVGGGTQWDTISHDRDDGGDALAKKLTDELARRSA